MQERAAVAFAAGSSLELRRGAAAERDLEDAEQIEREDEDERDERGEQIGILKLVAPVERRLELHDGGGEHQEKNEHAGDEREPEPEDAARVLPGLMHEAENFQRDHRQHAGHHIQDQSAEEGREAA